MILTYELHIGCTLYSQYERMCPRVANRRAIQWQAVTVLPQRNTLEKVC